MNLLLLATFRAIIELDKGEHVRLVIKEVK